MLAIRDVRRTTCLLLLVGFTGACAPLGEFRDAQAELTSLRAGHERSDARTAQLEADRQRMLADLASAADRLGGLQHDVSELRSDHDRRLREIEEHYRWRGRLDIGVTAGGWQLLYANSTGQSQFVYLRQAGKPQTAKIRVTDIRRLPLPPGAGAAGEETSPGAPEWDMSGIGSQRWMRLACGKEIMGKAEGGNATFHALVVEDRNPVVCN